MTEKDKSRGRPHNPNYDPAALKVKLMEIVLKKEYSGKLTMLKLEKMTGIPRQNWNKIKEEINKVNTGIPINENLSIPQVPLVDIQSIFDTYYGKDKAKLIQIFQDYNFHIYKLYEAAQKYEYHHKILELELSKQKRNYENEIQSLKEELKIIRRLKEHYEGEYQRLMVNKSINNLNNNRPIHIEKGNKKALDIVSYSEKFKNILDD